jgi:predicted phage tail protein
MATTENTQRTSSNTSELREVRLYGELGRKYGRIHRLAVKSTAEAIRALMANYKNFERDVVNAPYGFRIFDGREEITATPEMMHLQRNQPKDTIRIVPVLAGSKNPVVSIIIGIALICFAIFCPWGAIALYGTTTIGTVAVSIGVSLIISGVVSLLTPVPKAPTPGSSQDNQASYFFNGPVNTTAQGVPVPLGYGRMTVGSAVISAGINIANISLT